VPTSIRDRLAIVLVGCLVLLPNLGATTLWDLDEALWGNTTAEMARRGDWIVPWHNGEVLTDKPPFMYWVMLVGTRLCGENEFGFRIGAAMFALGTALVVHALGTTLAGRREGLLAGIATVTALNFTAVSRAAGPDIKLAFLVALAMLLFVRFAVPGGWPPRGRIGRLPWKAAVAIYAVLGLAVLTKGPLGFVLPTATLGLFLWWHDTAAAGESLAGRSLGGRAAFLARTWLAAAFAMRPLLGLAVVATVAGPWYAAVHQASGGAFGADFIGIHHVQRFLEPMEGHRGPIVYYVLALLVGLFPWSMFAIPTALDAAARLRGREGDPAGTRLLVSWLVTWLGIFSLAQTKLPNYILPAYPAAALLVASFLARWWQAPDAAARRWMQVALWLLLAIGGATAAVCLGFPALRAGDRSLLEAASASPLVGDVLRLAALGGGIMAAGAIACLLLVARDRRRDTILAYGGMAVALAVYLFGVVAVEAGRHQPARELVQILRDHGATVETPLGECGYTQPSLVLYAGRTVTQCGTATGMAEFFGAHPGGMVIVRVPPGREAAEFLPADTEIVGERPSFPKIGRMLVVRRTGVSPGTTTAAAPGTTVR
jgi:4-amino-4-deoxy-L-arabinose transferase-like glycosyltransferase